MSWEPTAAAAAAAARALKKMAARGLPGFAREEIGHVAEYDYVMINDDFNRAALDLRSIVRAERLKAARQLERHSSVINRMK